MSGLAERPVCRLEPEVRRAVLDAVQQHVTTHAELVSVEWSADRKFDGATRTVGTALAVARTPSGATDTVLVVQPINPERRAVAIPASQVLRIRAASQPWRSSNHLEWRDRVQLGRVLAGPAL